MTATSSNTPLRRLERALLLAGALALLSLIGYVAGLAEVIMWRGIALAVTCGLAYFLLQPTMRGVRAGDLVLANMWREIDTPALSESYLESAPTIALESGRVNQRIRVQLWDGSHGIVLLTHHGLLTHPEGRLVEAEVPRPHTHATDAP